MVLGEDDGLGVAVGGNSYGGGCNDCFPSVVECWERSSLDAALNAAAVLALLNL